MRYFRQLSSYIGGRGYGMNKVLSALIVLSMGAPASATIYVVPSGSSAAAIQAIVNTAGNAAGNTKLRTPHVGS